MPASFGKHWWNTGPNPTYKFGDQWVVSDRLLLDVQYAHVGNNFTLGLQTPDLRTTQPTFIISTGLNGRSATESVFIRPVNSVTVNSNYFLPGSGRRRPRAEIRRPVARFEHDVDHAHRRQRRRPVPERDAVQRQRLRRRPRLPGGREP